MTKKIALAILRKTCCNCVIEIAPYINKDVIEEKEEGEKDNHDFYRPFDTKVIEADVHWFLKLEAALAAM